jgi:hypothetical protein
MDLTDRQRRLLFVALVVVLAAVGVFLTLGGGSRDDAGAARTERPSSTPTTVPVAPPESLPPTTGPSPSYDIYSFLPFSRKDFNVAADVARRFTAAYGTYRFDEDPKTYAGRLRGMVTADLAGQLERDASAPGLLDQRRQDQEVSTSDARLDTIRDMGKDRLIFLVTGTQHIMRGGSASVTSQQYAVTMTRSGGGWVVFAFQPADIGDN